MIIRELAGQLKHRLHRIGGRGDKDETFLATASCSPTGRPHCTRSRDHSLAIFNASSRPRHS